MLGDDEAVNSFEKTKKRNTLKRFAVLEFEAGDDKHTVFLKRLLTVDTNPGWSGTNLVIREPGLEKATGTATPAAHRSAGRPLLESNSEPLNLELKTKCKPCVIRAAYLAQDDPSISEAVKSWSRRMSAPNENSLPGAQVSQEVPDDGEHALGSEHVQHDPCLCGHRPCRMCGDATQHRWFVCRFLT